MVQVSSSSSSLPVIFSIQEHVLHTISFLQSSVFTYIHTMICRDTCIQFLLDNVMKSALRIDGGLPVVQTELMEAYRVSI